MAIKINWQDLQKRIINWQEVQKVMLNWNQIRPSWWWTPWEESIDFTTQRTFPWWTTEGWVELSSNWLTVASGYSECRFVKDNVSFWWISEMIVGYVYRITWESSTSSIEFYSTPTDFWGRTQRYNGGTVYWDLKAANHSANRWVAWVSRTEAYYRVNLSDLSAYSLISNADTSVIIGYPLSFNITQEEANNLRQNNFFQFIVYWTPWEIYLERIDFYFV